MTTQKRYVRYDFVAPLKSDSHLPKKENFASMIALQNDEKFFYFILKALFVLKKFKIFSWHFGHVEKTAWWEGSG